MQDVDSSTTSELTSLADIHPVLSHAKLLLGNSHKLFFSEFGLNSKYCSSFLKCVCRIYAFIQIFGNIFLKVGFGRRKNAIGMS